MRGREAVERRGRVEDPVHDGLADQLRLDRAVRAVGRDPEMVQLVRQIGQVRDRRLRFGGRRRRPRGEEIAYGVSKQEQ